MLQKMLLKWCCRKRSSKKTSASVASKCTSTFLFICLFFTLVFLLRCSRWWRTCLIRHHLLHQRKNKEMTMSLPACHHLLTWEKNKEMTTSRGGSLSSAALEEKKGKEMTMSQGGSPSSTTPKKMQKMPMSWEAPGSLSSFGILWFHWLHHHLSWVFMISLRSQRLHHHLMHLLGFCDISDCIRWHLLGFCDLSDCIRWHLLGFYDPIDYITTFPGFLWSCWDLRDCITTWCISWDFVISVIASGGIS